MSKFCKKCGQTKDDSQFYRSPRYYSGLSGYCKECEKERKRIPEDRLLRHPSGIDSVSYHKQYYIDNRERLLDKNRLYFKSYYQNNKEKRLENSRKYYSTPNGRLLRINNSHKRRCREKLSTKSLSLNDIKCLLITQDNRCAHCKLEFNDSNKYTIDHIIPLIRGGGLSIDNVQLLCKSCNSSKGANTIRYRQETVYNFMEA